MYPKLSKIIVESEKTHFLEDKSQSLRVLTNCTQLPEFCEFLEQVQTIQQSFQEWLRLYDESEIQFEKSWGSKIMEAQILAIAEFVVRRQHAKSPLSGKKIRSLSAVLRSNHNTFSHLQHARRSLKEQTTHPLSDSELYYLTEARETDPQTPARSYSQKILAETLALVEERYQFRRSRKKIDVALRLVSCFALPLLLLWNR
jgi:hypothetical protein